MSLGNEGYAKLLDEDAGMVIYEFKVAHLDLHYDSKKKSVFDDIAPGYFYIQRDCFLDPEIHEKIKRRPSGRKYLEVKRIPVDVPVGDYIKEGKVVIEPCTFWRYMDSNYFTSEKLTWRILNKIFQQYQLDSFIPKHVYFAN